VTRNTLIAVPIIAADPPLDAQVRAAQAAGADLVELRVDCIGDIRAVVNLLMQPRTLPLIVTVRSAAEGGAWTADESARLALLEQLAGFRPDYLDVEYATWQSASALRYKVVQVGQTATAAPTRLILSHHSLADTPAHLGPIFDELAAMPADVIKAVFTPRDATDACRVLAQLRARAAERAVIALALGEPGLPARILARKFGAFCTFATLAPDRQSAAGQPTLADLRDLYRWDQIGPDTRVYGVVGWPVAHSQSPAIHNAALSAAGSAAVYVPFAVQPGAADFAAFMEHVHGEAELAIDGLSVTLPHKENALDWLAACGFPVAPPARQCGAVNTLVRAANGTWHGHNTDGLGALAALQTASRVREGGLRGRTVAVLGAGGAARAIVAALQNAGCQTTVYARSPRRAQHLAQDLRCACQPWAARMRYTGDILINCTPVGMWPAVAETPMPPEALRPDTVVFDVVYRPTETQLVRAARERGCEVVGGAAMFLAQAAAQFELWHSQSAPIETMRAALGSGTA
jgi:3-dehydroquinate dehydratase/shikimate dehydrogenase